LVYLLIYFIFVWLC